MKKNRLLKPAILFFGVMGLSMSVHAAQTISVGEVLERGLLKVGTQVGQCEVVKIKALRVYGTGPISGVQLVISDGQKEIMALLNETLNLSMERNLSVLTSRIDSSTGGDSPLSGLIEKKTSLAVTMLIEQKSTSEVKLSQITIEKKKANFFGSMKLVDADSIECME